MIIYEIKTKKETEQNFIYLAFHGDWRLRVAGESLDIGQLSKVQGPMFSFF